MWIAETTFNFFSISVNVTIPAETEWFKINANQTGFYRVNYDAKDWKNFEQSLKKNVTVMLFGELLKYFYPDVYICLNAHVISDDGGFG